MLYLKSIRKRSIGPFPDGIVTKGWETMNALILRNRSQGNTTLLDNEFIDQYMVKANGEYVKVYLLLLRHLNNPSMALSISQIADLLNHTEGDVLRALKYWEKEQLLTLEYNETGHVIGLEMGKVPRKERPSIVPMPASGKPVVSEMPLTAPASKTAAPTDSKRNRKELKGILFIAEQYLGKTLSRTDVDAIAYFYETLCFSADLIEYLIEYCVENGHKSMHYIQKVAIAWSESGITTVEQARNSSALYNKTCYSILNAFGIKGRGPASSELDFIKKWTDLHGIDLSIILEACRRTMSAIHQPSFEYTDKILMNWQSQNVKSLTDIQALDSLYEQQRSKRKPVPPAQAVHPNSKFRNFDERSYDDMDELTKKLLHM